VGARLERTPDPEQGSLSSRRNVSPHRDALARFPSCVQVVFEIQTKTAFFPWHARCNVVARTNASMQIISQIVPVGDYYSCNMPFYTKEIEYDVSLTSVERQNHLQSHVTQGDLRGCLG